MTATPEQSINLLRHPVRVQILAAVGSGNDSPKSVAAALPHVPTATIYRHVTALIQGGALLVTAMRSAGTQKERVLAVNPERTTLSSTDSSRLSKEQLLGMVNALLSGVEVSFQRYADSHGEFETGDFALLLKPLYISDADYASLRQSLIEFVESHSAPQSESDRVRTIGLFSVVE